MNFVGNNRLRKVRAHQKEKRPRSRGSSKHQSLKNKPRSRGIREESLERELPGSKKQALGKARRKKT